jgi:hypothetical protein
MDIDINTWLKQKNGIKEARIGWWSPHINCLTKYFHSN